MWPQDVVAQIHLGWILLVTALDRTHKLNFVMDGRVMVDPGCDRCKRPFTASLARVRLLWGMLRIIVPIVLRLGGELLAALAVVKQEAVVDNFEMPVQVVLAFYHFETNRALMASFLVFILHIYMLDHLERQRLIWGVFLLFNPGLFWMQVLNFSTPKIKIFYLPSLVFIPDNSKFRLFLIHII